MLNKILTGDKRNKKMGIQNPEVRIQNKEKSFKKFKMIHSDF